MVRLKSIAILRVVALTFVPVTFEAVANLVLQALRVLTQNYMACVRDAISTQDDGATKLPLL